MPHFIFIQQISVLNILNMLYNLHFFFSSKCRLFHNATLFGFCITHILNTGCAKIKKKSVAKRLKCVLREQGGVALTGFIWLRTSGGLLWTRYWVIEFHIQRTFVSSIEHFTILRRTALPAGKIPCHCSLSDFFGRCDVTASIACVIMCRDALW